MAIGHLRSSVLGEETEIKVIEKARNGDRKAIRLLYDRYSGYLAATCARYLADRGDQKDVLQDSFVKVFSSMDKFDYRGEGSLKAWMRQVVVNECLKMLRHRRRSVPIVYEGELRDVEEEDDIGPPDVVDVPAAAIHEMIKELPDGYRAVFNLFVLEEKSHKEISEMLGITESTSASQFHRARIILAKKIKEYKQKVKIKR